MQLVDFLVAFRLIIQAFEHHFFVFFGNRHVRDAGRIFNHFLGDLLRTFGFCLRPQHSRKECSGQTHPRARLHEISTIQHFHPPH